MNRFVPFLLTLLAMVGAALNPSGYMVQAGTSGVTFGICSGRDNARVTIAPDDPLLETFALIYGKDETPDQKPAHEEACPFAGVGVAGPLPSLAKLAGPDIGRIDWQTRALPPVSVRAPRANPPATGPPVRV